MKFSDIIGQEHVISQLSDLVLNNRLSHALLFHGPEGVGKKALALAFAQYIVCENKQGHESCGECPACRKAAKWVHPDIHFVFPVIKDGSKKSISDTYISEWRAQLDHSVYFSYADWNEALGDGKKSSAIYVDESSEMIKKLNFKPFEAEHKVMIIWLAEKMNVQTANKLLKTLEEPSEKTVLILIAENLDFMLSTILSRVQQIKIPPIDSDSLKQYIEKEYQISDDLRNFALKYGKGSVLKTLEAISQSEQSQRYHEWFVQFMRLSYKNSMLDLIKLIDEIIKTDKVEVKGFLNYSIRYIRDNFMLNLQQNHLVSLVADEFQFAEKFSTYINPNNIEKIYTSFNQTIEQIERNANVKIQFQVLAIEMVRAFKMG